MTMQDFLTFQTFITPTLLIVMYYIGALFIPIISWYLASWIKKSYFTNVSAKIKEEVQIRTSLQQRILFYSVSIFCFLCLEIFWRVMFEFLIAYFDMHDTLMRLI